MLWTCGHSEVLELAWLPTTEVRRRRAVATARAGGCVSCLVGDGGGIAPGVLVPFPDVGRAPERGVEVCGQPGFDELVAGGARWIEVVGGEELVVGHVPDGCRVDVAPGAGAVVAGPGPVVRSWGRTRVGPGGRVAGGPGSRTELVGGSAAVSEGGTLVAARGAGVVDGGARLVVLPGDEDADVVALPWSVVTTARGTGVVPGRRGVVRPGGDLDPVLRDLLEISRGMDARL